MPISPSLEQMLNHAGITYQISALQAGEDPARQVQLMLLEDPEGLVQLLFPRSDLIDLDYLQEGLGRPLVRISKTRLHPLASRHHFRGAAPRMPLPGITTLVEQRLLEQSHLYLATEDPAAPMLELTTASLTQLVPDFTPRALTLPAPPLAECSFNPAADEAALASAVRRKTDLEIRARLEDTLEIPPLQETAKRIIRLRAEPEPEMQALIHIVETDPSLAAQVVSWANSSYYGNRGPVKSIEDAIIRVLGFDMVINLALALALGQSLQLPAIEPQGATPYWRQAAYSATAMEALVRLIPLEQRPELGLSYLIGLLHNFGYLVMAHVFGAQFKQVCQHLEVNPHLPSPVIENHLLGVSREQMSAWLMQSWDMPEEVVVALRFQHYPHYQGTHARYAHLLTGCNALLGLHGIGNSTLQAQLPKLLQTLSLDAEKAQHAVAQLIENGESIDQLSQCFSSLS